MFTGTRASEGWEQELGADGWEDSPPRTPGPAASQSVPINTFSRFSP